jgi:hypothetical protein
MASLAGTQQKKINLPALFWRETCKRILITTGRHRVLADKVALLRFMLNERKISVYGLEFGCINAIVARHLVGENLVPSGRKSGLHRRKHSHLNLDQITCLCRLPCSVDRQRFVL